MFVRIKMSHLTTVIYITRDENIFNSSEENGIFMITKQYINPSFYAFGPFYIARVFL